MSLPYPLIKTYFFPACVRMLVMVINRTEWSPIRFVIIRVITKIGVKDSDLFITIESMITDRIGRHKVLLPINHKNYNVQEKKNIKA